MKYKLLILPALLACMALTSCQFGHTSDSGTSSSSISSSSTTSSLDSSSTSSQDSSSTSTSVTPPPPISTSTPISVPDDSDSWYFTTSSISWQIKEENLLTYTSYTDTNSYECHFNVAIESGDVFKIMNGNNITSLGYANLEGETDLSKYSNDLPSEGGIKTNATDEYDIYVNVLNDRVSLEVIAASSFPTLDINFSAINDFHGAIERDVSSGKYIPGLAYLAAYLKQRKAEGDILINSGDMWQGTFESNFNSGSLVTEAFRNIGFDAQVLGNHEFDWGPEAILANQELSGTTYLGANIYNYDASRTPAYSTKSNLGGNYVIKTLNEGTVNEIKVGIIGVIGKDQLSSIQANHVKDYVFIDPTETVKTLSQELRSEQDCDIVIATYHAGQDDVNKEIVGGTYGNGTKYVDAVFCAHTHRNEISYVNNVPFIQSGSNGNYVGRLSLRLTRSTSAVSYVSASNANLVYLSSLTADSEVQSIIDRYNADSSSTGAEVIGTSSSEFESSGNLANAIAKGMYDAAYKQGVTDVDYAITNYARNSISAGTITYGDVYTAVPFDNAIVIFEASGQDIYNELVRYSNYVYRATDEALVNSSSRTYKVAVCSYLAYHVRVDDYTYLKTMNYFPSMNNEYELEDGNGKVITYRQSLLDLLRGVSGTINPNTYTGARYDSGRLTSAL